MNSWQLHYLRAMDIDVWQRREVVQQLTVSSADAVAAEQKVVLPVALGNPIEPVSRDTVSDSVETHQVAPVTLESWSDVETAVRNCTRCELHSSRTQTVFGVGNREAEWMIIGEAPGADEDRQGEPFVGRAGQLLNAMLLAIGLRREQVFIANILKCRPPDNRDPKPNEVSCCMPYLQRQIDLINPRIILCVGRIAAQNLLSTDTPIGKLRGTVHRFGAQQRPVVVTYHPAYLLRSPGEKRKAWIDLQFALQTFTSLQSFVS